MTDFDSNKETKNKSDFKAFVRNFYSYSLKQKLDPLRELGRLTANLVSVFIFEDCENVWYFYMAGVIVIICFLLTFFMSVVCTLKGHYSEGIIL